MPARERKDPTAKTLLVFGVLLAALATFLPVIEVEGQGGGLALTTWQLLPWFAKLKFLALAMLLAAALLPQLARWRLVMAAGAVAMVFLPSIATFLAALHAWGSLGDEIVRLSGQATPVVHPGLANAVLVAAAVAVSYAVWRLESAAEPAGPDDQAAAAV